LAPARSAAALTAYRLRQVASGSIRRRVHCCTCATRTCATPAVRGADRRL